MRQWPFVFAFALSHAYAGSTPAPLLGTGAAPVHHPMHTCSCTRCILCAYVYLVILAVFAL